MPARGSDSGVGVAQSGAYKVWMRRDPLAYVVELVVAPRIIATSFQDKPPVGSRVAQLGSSPVWEPCHKDGVCHGVVTVSR